MANFEAFTHPLASLRNAVETFGPAALVFILLLGAGMLAVHLLRTKLARLQPQYRATALLPPVWLLLAASALAVARSWLPPEIQVTAFFRHVPHLGFVLGLFWLADRALTRMASRSHFFNATGGTQTSRNFVLRACRMILVVLGILVALDTVGVSITPVLASLGVGSLAIALALQDTLSNFFSGIYLLVDRPLRVGDYIRAPDNIEGTVERIGWRSTRILHPARHMIIAPNSKLSSAVLQNLDLPDPRTVVTVEVTVHFDSDLEMVENIARQAAYNVMSHNAEEVTQREPAVKYQGFRDLGVVLQVGIEAVNLRIRSNIVHELTLAVHTSLRNNGVLFVNQVAPVHPAASVSPGAPAAPTQPPVG